MRGTGRIVTLRGRGEIPRLQADARLVQGQLAPLAQVGRVADAVEVHDPSGILTVAEDLPGGAGVRLGLAQTAIAHGTPADGAGLSVPLLDSARRPIMTIGPYLLSGYCRALLLQDPAGMPSGMGLYVGVVTGGPLSVATRGVVWTLLHAPGGQQAGMWRTGWQYLTTGGVWAETRAAWNVDDPRGIHGTWGQLSGTPGQFQGLSTAPLRDHNGGTTALGFPGVVLAGPDPHLVFGVLWADPPTAPDEVSFLPLGKWQQPDEVT